MTRSFHGQFLGVAALVVATVAACGGGSDQPSPSPATTPAPPATSTSTATASPPATTTPTTAPSPRATATATPSPTPVPSPATATPSPTPPATPDATTFRYDTYDTTGAVSTPGSYAFLSDPDDTSTVVTTYEALRDGPTTALLIHKSDADGASLADVYDAMEAGDLFEWHQADDCFVRYTVTEVKPDPTGTVPRKLLAVEWMTYAFTGCSGPISANANVGMTWDDLLDLGGETLTVPVIHGTYQLLPRVWTGEVKGLVREGSLEDQIREESLSYTTIEGARTLPHWREPTIPAGWELGFAYTGGLGTAGPGFYAEFLTNTGQLGFSLGCGPTVTSFGTQAASWHDGSSVAETRVIAGRPAMILYSPRGLKDTKYSWSFPVTVDIFDAATATRCSYVAYDLSLAGDNIDFGVAIIASLFEDAPAGTTTFRYDTYDTTGAVSTAGSYAFLSDPDDTSTAVTTYEALRDGTTTALLIHTSDAGGASRAGVYDAVEAGDLFEWRQADACFVRYTVTEVKPDPTGTVPRKLLAVEWMTYAFAGCSGTIDVTGAGYTISLAPANITSPDVTSPIRHGNWLMVPQDWTGEVEDEVLIPNRQSPECEGDPPATLEEHAFGRRPALPDDWVVERVQELRCSVLWVSYRSADWTASVDVYISRGWAVPVHIPWVDPSAVGQIDEATMIDGHPAILSYDRYGFGVDVRIYHSSGIKYQVQTSSQSLTSNRQAVIDIARSLYDTPSPTPVAPGPTTFRYDTYDTTGAVSTPGSYAFLSNPDDTSTVVTTYEALRDGTTTALLIHKSDADGASRADVYDAVEVGDLFEWHQADDCFLRYLVTEVKPDPTGTAARKLLAVEWMTYAFTGCSGAVPSDLSASVAWGELPDLGGPSLTEPVMHGAFQLVPHGWDGEVRNYKTYDPPGDARAKPVVQEEFPSQEMLDALPYYSEPDLPAGWRLTFVSSGTKSDPELGYNATYGPSTGGIGLGVTGHFYGMRGIPQGTAYLGGVVETRVIDDRVMLVAYSPPGPDHDPRFHTQIWVFDSESESGYNLIAYSDSLRDLDVLVGIARSLFTLAPPATSAEPTPVAPEATTFRYDTYDTTGAVATAGSYAFLSNPDDTSTVVTTYEALRDGTTTALLIHTSDAGGASQAALYDTVEAGDLFEWRQADDCFVRYTVTEVRPDPVGTVPGKLLAVEWLTYAFTGCSGTVSIGDSAIMTWGELADFGGTNLRFPVVHGPFQLAPEGWVGTVEAVRSYDPPAYSLNSPVSTSDAIVARSLPYWREPTLPAGWIFSWASSGEISGPIYGYCALFATADGYAGVEVCGFYRTSSRAVIHSSRAQGRIAYETRVLAGRPGWVRYSPKGPEHSDVLSIRVAIYDEDTQSMYVILGQDGSLRGGDVDAVIAIAESLFEDAPAAADTFRYDTYDTTGAVATAGSYAFLADPDDTSTVVTTYEGLRDGTATALLIHTSDADGLSRAGIYDAVEVGDLFAWQKADDCFVRYRVTDVPEADVTATHREFGVRSETYVFQGCRTGSLPTSGLTVKFTAAAALPLEHLGGTRLTDFAVVHGVRQLVPDGTLLPSGEVVPGTGIALESVRLRDLTPLARGVPNTTTGDLAESRRLPYWREPRLPEGWSFASTLSGDYADADGYIAYYTGPAGQLAVTIMGVYASVLPISGDASWTVDDDQRLIVREPRVIAGRPATVTYSPLGAQHHRLASVRVEVYDPATGVGYIVTGRSGSLGLRGGPDAAERVVAIARSLFEGENAP